VVAAHQKGHSQWQPQSWIMALQFPMVIYPILYLLEMLQYCWSIQYDFKCQL